MANEAKKRSSWIGKERTDRERYVTDLDRDIFNLFQEKTINIKHTKRYSYTVASSYGA